MRHKVSCGYQIVLLQCSLEGSTKLIEVFLQPMCAQSCSSNVANKFVKNKIQVSFWLSCKICCKIIWIIFLLAYFQVEISKNCLRKSSELEDPGNSCWCPCRWNSWKFLNYQNLDRLWRYEIPLKKYINMGC